MRVAFVGKGGSGKTSLSSLFALYLSQFNKTLAIDADINQHLSEGLGISDATCPELGHNLDELYHILGSNSQSVSAIDDMIKTTPPSPGSHIMSIDKDDPIVSKFAHRDGNLYFMRVGELESDDIGAKCYHSKNGAVELLLNHTLEADDEYILVDMIAGSDAFSSGLFTRFDVTFLVVEPTLKSVSVLKQYKSYASEYNIEIKAVGNKVEKEDDLSFLKKHCGSHLITSFFDSNWIKKKDKSIHEPLDALEKENKEALDKLRQHLSTYSRDWDAYWKWGIHFHLKNAKGWGNQAKKKDLTKQIDEDYLYSLNSNNN